MPNSSHPSGDVAGGGEAERLRSRGGAGGQPRRQAAAAQQQHHRRQTTGMHTACSCTRHLGGDRH